MKNCLKCNNLKDYHCFNKYIKAIDGLFSWCRDCFKAYKKEKYHKNILISRIYTNKKRAARIKWFQELKSNSSCLDCGNKYEPFCMDYDHIIERGKKINHVSKMVLNNTSKENILKEIEKCDLVCVLCHNKRTHDRLNIFKKYKPNQSRNIEIINKFKNKPCAICNNQYDYYNMQADHIDPNTKLYDICQLKSYKLDVLNTELVKCQVLCALCHRRKSITEQQENKYNSIRCKPVKKQKSFYDHTFNIKECGRCHRLKPNSDYYINKKMCLFSYCKDCFNQYRRERRKPLKSNL